jgi:NhaC family Na+:H+ antiporter
MPQSREQRAIGLGFALIPIVFLIGSLSVVISIYHLSPHVPLIGAAAMAAAVGVYHRVAWKEIQDGLVHGVVPTMIFYGLKVLSPGIFLVATMIICSIVSLGTGSSWSTAGTVGVALMGVGGPLGIPLPIVAGAIISGAYFGDKMSPLSDTTNLAPAVAGTDVFSHVRHMIYTTGPSYVIALVLYALIGMKYAGGSLETQQLGVMLDTMRASFFIHPVLLLPPLLVIVMVVMRIPPLPALLAGTAIGGICALAAQGSSMAQVIDAAHAGYVSQTGVAAVDELLSRGGLMSMMETVALIMCALAFGGIMERTGMLEVIARSLLKLVKGTGSLVATTIFSCIGMNVVASDQYMAIVIPGRMYRNAFLKRRLHPKNLSRALEDAGTLTSPLIPWNSCGAFMGATLGLSPLLYLPYAFLNLMNPLVSLFYGFTGITMEKLPADAEVEDGGAAAAPLAAEAGA